MIPMSLMKEGSTGHIARLDGGQELKRKLRVIGIREGKAVTLVAHHPLGGPIVIEVDGRQTTLGRRMAQRILVDH